APTVSINSVSQLEGNSGTTAYTFTVSLSAASTSTVTVNYATANGTASAGSDYLATSGTLTFAPGQTQQTITGYANGDTGYEPNETFSVVLSAPTGADLGTSQGVGTIQNDDIGPDRYELNNTAAAATNFGRGNGVNQSTLSLDTASDVDYYAFTPNKKANYTVTVALTQGTDTTCVVLLDARQNVVPNGQSSPGM